MEKEAVTISLEENAMRAVLPKDIDHHIAKYIRSSIDRSFVENMPRRLILDFSGVSFMDSSGVGLIIGRSELARKYGAVTELVGISPDIMRLVRICGVERIKDLYILQ